MFNCYINILVCIIFITITFLLFFMNIKLILSQVNYFYTSKMVELIVLLH